MPEIGGPRSTLVNLMLYPGDNYPDREGKHAFTVSISNQSSSDRERQVSPKTDV
jgi:hypothetical protein